MNKKLIFLVQSKLFWLGLMILTFGVLVNDAFGVYSSLHPGPSLNDFLLQSLPYMNVPWAYDLFGFMSALLVLFYFYWHLEDVPYFMVIMGIFEILRGLFIFLTPLGAPPGDSVGIINGVLGSQAGGFFPSGHTGGSFIIFLVTKGWWKVAAFICFLGVVVFLLIAHGHYSIDILAGILFAYAIYAFGNKHFRDRLTVRFPSSKKKQ